jgi:hypothetical protein
MIDDIESNGFFDNETIDSDIAEVRRRRRWMWHSELLYQALLHLLDIADAMVDTDTDGGSEMMGDESETLSVERRWSVNSRSDYSSDISSDDMEELDIIVD